MQKRVIIIITIIVSITIAAVFYAQKKGEHQMQKFSVTASFYVLGNFIENIGGDTVSVYVITPSGIEPHDYEPTPSDLIMVGRSKLFIYNGGGFDPWAEKLISSLNKGSVATLAINEHINDQVVIREKETNIPNPHYWLDPMFAIKEVEIIRDILIEKNPQEARTYQENARVYIEKLKNLDQEYEVGLRSCAIRDIIVSHDAFAYLGSQYTIHTIPIAGISPESEPSAKKIGEIAMVAREKGIRFVFFETAASPKLAETIAREVGIETLVLNPIETLTENELKTGEDYIAVMEKNLNNLRKALSCI
ncbi:MAG: zinc ABC transporter substrate-binding protein [Candidatus Yonathbacteria bacterium]|nr:zinc ABC transporter substrate-binding protein [Candidatus Yonathbacteria bacterium]